ncbi:MAG TPA: DUF1328 domain-containing protein, partial [Anaerolineales bacterium]|nr:DUF1328 domain-containing protein [Anaerolineales bacterium]
LQSRSTLETDEFNPSVLRKAMKGVNMDLLQWALIAFVVAIVAGMFGFTGVAQGAASMGRLLFGLFLVVAVVFLVLALLGVSILT